MTLPPHPARVIQLAAILTPPLAVVAPLGFAVLLPVTALGAALGAWHKAGFRRPPAGPVVIVLALLAWGALSASWAFEPRLVWSTWRQIAGIALPGLILLGIARGLDDEMRDAIGMALALGTVIALALLSMEWISAQLFDDSLGAMLSTRRPFRSYIFNRGAATLAILVWPAVFAVHRRRGLKAAAALLAATLLVIAQFASGAAVLGLIAGSVTWALAAWRSRPVAVILACGIALGALSAPFVLRIVPVVAVPERCPDPAFVPLAEKCPVEDVPFFSAVHRLQIWHFVAEAIAQRPLLGWGLNASRELPGGIEEFAPGARRLPLHPHNALLQWWLELGLVGAALGTALIILAVHGAARLRPVPADMSIPARAAALALVCSAVCVALVGYGIWQSWWMAVLWLAAGFMAAIGGSSGLPAGHADRDNGARFK